MGDLGMTLNSSSRRLWIVQLSFIAITPRSTMTRSGSTCLDPIYESNRFVWKIFVLDSNTWNHMTERKSLVLDKNCWKHITLCGMCPWCNGYRRRKWTRRHEFKSWTRLIAFHIALIPLGKGMNPVILPPAMGK